MSAERARLLQVLNPAAPEPVPGPPPVEMLLEQARALVEGVRAVRVGDVAPGALPYLVAAEKQLMVAVSSLSIATIVEPELCGGAEPAPSVKGSPP